MVKAPLVRAQIEPLPQIEVYFMEPQRPLSFRTRIGAVCRVSVFPKDVEVISLFHTWRIIRFQISQGILNPRQHMFHHQRIGVDVFTVPKHLNEDPALTLSPNPA